MTDRTTDLRVEEFRRQKKERLELLKRGDISTALSSISLLWNTYNEMSQTLRRALESWSDTVKLQRKETDAGLKLVEQFNRNADKLLGDSLRIVLKECELRPDEITDIADDNRFNALLDRIAKADPMSAMRLTSDGYTIAVKTLGSYATKIIGLKNKSIENGASEAEVANASAIVPKFERAVEIVKHRKDVMLELNLKYKREIGKFVDKHTINPSKGRGLTDEEKEILKGLI